MEQQSGELLAEAPHHADRESVPRAPTARKAPPVIVEPSLPGRLAVMRPACGIPYRIDLAGGWLDQPHVSKFAAGPVITISIEPRREFSCRSGLASSTRRTAIELWQTAIPRGDKAQLAKELFLRENGTGKEYVSGSQDAIGIVFPGLNRLDYDGDAWPKKIASVLEEGTMRWLEQHLQLISLGPREASFDVQQDTHITPGGVRRLASAAEECWKSILAKDLPSFGEHLRNSFEAQVALFPRMMNDGIRSAIESLARQSLGWKLSGAGGGGYLILVSQREIRGAIRIRIRRGSNRMNSLSFDNHCGGAPWKYGISQNPQWHSTK